MKTVAGMKADAIKGLNERPDLLAAVASSGLSASEFVDGVGAMVTTAILGRVAVLLPAEPDGASEPRVLERCFMRAATELRTFQAETAAAGGDSGPDVYTLWAGFKRMTRGMPPGGA